MGWDARYTQGSRKEIHRSRHIDWAGSGFVLQTGAYAREGIGNWEERCLRDECGSFHPSVSSDEFSKEFQKSFPLFSVRL